MIKTFANAQNPKTIQSANEISKHHLGSPLTDKKNKSLDRMEQAKGEEKNQRQPPCKAKGNAALIKLFACFVSPYSVTTKNGPNLDLLGCNPDQAKKERSLHNLDYNPGR